MILLYQQRTTHVGFNNGRDAKKDANAAYRQQSALEEGVV
jgi:hypothetical protein